MSTKRGMSLVVLGVSLLIVGILTWQAQKQTQNQPSGEWYDVKKVVDGDTIEIERYGRKEDVRLIGIDTPEVVDPRKTVQCFGREASAKAHEVLEHKRVRLEFDPLVGERDKYNRILAYVWEPDGTLYNQFMIASGFAHEYTYQSQPYKYQAEFKQAEANARASEVGFWSPQACGGNTKQAAP